MTGNIGRALDEGQDARTRDFHSSVACGRDKCLPNVPHQDRYDSLITSILIKTFKEINAEVFII